MSTLLLDLSTIENTPRFFSLLALVLRASGFEVIVMDGDAQRKGGDKVAGLAGVPLHEYHQWNGAGDVQAWKLSLAEAHALRGKTVWVDEELGRWKGPSTERANLTVVNWRAVLEQGGVSTPAVSA